MLHPRVGTAGPVSADQDRAGPGGVGELRERQVQDGDVIGGGVRPGVADSQDPGQRLVGVVQVGNDRVVAEPALERACQVVCVSDLGLGSVEVTGEPVGVGECEGSEGGFPACDSGALDEFGFGFSFAGREAAFLGAGAGSFVLDHARELRGRTICRPSDRSHPAADERRRRRSS